METESPRIPPGDKDTAAWLATLSDDERRAWWRRTNWDAKGSANGPDEEQEDAS